MSNAPITVRSNPNGTFTEILPDGTERPYAGAGTDWARVSAMGDREIEANAENDPDARAYSAEDLSRIRREPVARTVRRRLGLSQHAFAELFGIPVGTLRDWEQGRAQPDAPARTLLKVIASEPEAVMRAMKVADE